MHPADHSVCTVLTPLGRSLNYRATASRRRHLLFVLERSLQPLAVPSRDPPAVEGLEPPRCHLLSSVYVCRQSRRGATADISTGINTADCERPAEIRGDSAGDGDGPAAAPVPTRALRGDGARSARAVPRASRRPVCDGGLVQVLRDSEVSPAFGSSATDVSQNFDSIAACFDTFMQRICRT